jgi:hypothetical protein
MFCPEAYIEACQTASGSSHHHQAYTCGAQCCQLRARDFGQFNFKFAAGEKSTYSGDIRLRGFHTNQTCMLGPLYED